MQNTQPKIKMINQIAACIDTLGGETFTSVMICAKMNMGTTKKDMSTIGSGLRCLVARDLISISSVTEGRAKNYYTSAPNLTARLVKWQTGWRSRRDEAIATNGKNFARYSLEHKTPAPFLLDVWGRPTIAKKLLKQESHAGA